MASKAERAGRGRQKARAFAEGREELAALQHDIWSHWMRYLFTKGTIHGDGRFTIDAESVERWVRQMDTDYANLSERERESDREQADKVLALLIGPDALRMSLEVE